MSTSFGQSLLTKEQIGLLMQPLHPGRVKQRSQGGASLSYVEAYDIKATLIRIFGFGGFSSQVLESSIIAIREAPTTPGHVDRDGQPKTPQAIASATVMLTVFGIGPRGEDVVYTESAVGANSGRDIGDICDNAIKTAESDALKRCAVYLGSQFGLSLYNNGSQAEIIRRLFQADQAAMLAEYQAENPALFPNQANTTEQVAGALARATGQQQEVPQQEAQS